MNLNYYRVIDRRTNNVVVVGTMSELAKHFEVSKSAIFRAEKRGSHFLRYYKVERVDANSVR